MGLLYERTCGHCKHLFEAITVGVCEVTDHRVERVGDEYYAKGCPYYDNKYGYDKSGKNPVKEQLAKAKLQGGDKTEADKRKMKNIDALRVMDRNKVVRVITGVALKILRHYASDAEISHFDEADIEASIRRFLDKEYIRTP